MKPTNEMTDTLRELLDELEELERVLEADTLPDTAWAADVVRRAAAALEASRAPEALADEILDTYPIDRDWLIQKLASRATPPDGVDVERDESR